MSEFIIKEIAEDYLDEAADDILGLWLLHSAVKRYCKKEEIETALIKVVKEMMNKHGVKVGSFKRFGDGCVLSCDNKDTVILDVSPWDSRTEKKVEGKKGYFRAWDVDNEKAFILIERALNRLNWEPNILDNIEFVAPGNPYLEEAEEVLE